MTNNKTDQRPCSAKQGLFCFARRPLCAPLFAEQNAALQFKKHGERIEWHEKTVSLSADHICHNNGVGRLQATDMLKKHEKHVGLAGGMSQTDIKNWSTLDLDMVFAGADWCFVYNSGKDTFNNLKEFFDK